MHLNPSYLNSKKRFGRYTPLPTLVSVRDTPNMNEHNIFWLPSLSLGMWVVWESVFLGLTHLEVHTRLSFRTWQQKEEALNHGVLARGLGKDFGWVGLSPLPLDTPPPHGHPSPVTAREWMSFTLPSGGLGLQIPACASSTLFAPTLCHWALMLLAVFILFVPVLLHFASASAVFMSLPFFSSEQSVPFDKPATSTVC